MGTPIQSKRCTIELHLSFLRLGHNRSAVTDRAYATETVDLDSIPRPVKTNDVEAGNSGRGEISWKRKKGTASTLTVHIEVKNLNVVQIFENI